MDKMEKIQLLAGNLDKFLKFIFWVVVIANMFIVVTIIWTMIAGNESVFWEQFVKQTTFNNLQITPADDFQPQMKDAYALLVCRLVINIVWVIACGRGIVLIRNILQPVSKAEPFDGSISRNLKKLGILIFAAGVVLDVCEFIRIYADFRAFNLVEVLYSDKIEHVMLNGQIDLSFILVGFFVLLLSMIFRYGEELQQLSDETL